MSECKEMIYGRLVIENPNLSVALIRAAEEIVTLRAELEKLRWIPVTDRLPELPDDDGLIGYYHSFRFDGNEYVVFSCQYFCRCKFDDQIIYSPISYNFDRKKWYIDNDLQQPIEVTHWQEMPEVLKVTP